MLAEVVRRLDAGGIALSELALRQPTLDDVFLALTGHTAEGSIESTVKVVGAGRRGHDERSAS